MFDPIDAVFAARLERVINLALHGDRDVSGLYHQILSSQSFEQFKFTAGSIYAYEAVLAEMQKIARGMNEERPQSVSMAMN